LAGLLLVVEELVQRHQMYRVLLAQQAVSV
jgi:hypothetical protein